MLSRSHIDWRVEGFWHETTLDQASYVVLSLSAKTIAGSVRVKGFQHYTSSVRAVQVHFCACKYKCTSVHAVQVHFCACKYKCTSVRASTSALVGGLNLICSTFL